jgi:hypothetical protein
MAAPSRRIAVPDFQKAALRQYRRQNPLLGHSELINWFKAQFEREITRGQVSQWTSAVYNRLDTPSGTDSSSSRKRKRLQNWPELESALFTWLKWYEERGGIISGDLLRLKAEKFWSRIEVYRGQPLPSLSTGWLQNFKERYGIKKRVKHGEAASVDVEKAAKEMLEIAKVTETYRPCDIYNCDETGVFWKLVPDASLSTTAFNTAGTKKEKARITVHFCCNADGSHKLKPWIIGTARKPRAFQAAGVDMNRWNMVWRFNGSAWMLNGIFLEWLRWFDNEVSGRRVLLLMDNFSAHTAAVATLEALPPSQRLQHVQIVWLPPNSTSRYQPLDQGIINAFKARYRQQWLEYMCEEVEVGRNPIKTINILKACRFIIFAWFGVKGVTPEIISNCWIKSCCLGFPEGPQTFEQYKNRPRPVEQLPLPIEQEAELYQLSERLQRRGRIYEIMDISRLVNPPEELITDREDEIEERIVAQWDPEVAAESEEEVEEVEKVSVGQAIKALETVLRHEEQQGDASAVLLLQRHQHELRQRREASRRQQQIDNYFIK